MLSIRPRGRHLSTDLSTVTVDNRAIASAAGTGVLRVVIDAPLRHAFDYLAPAGLAPAAVPLGVRVRVPVGRREAIGTRRPIEDKEAAGDTFALN